MIIYYLVEVLITVDNLSTDVARKGVTMRTSHLVTLNTKMSIGDRKGAS